MIPKHLFFIWTGNNQPDYVNFCIDAFKKVNPDFKVDLIRYTLEEIENIDKVNKSIYDIDVKNTIDYLLSKKSKFTNEKIRYIICGRRFLQILNNMLRIELVSKYGGIYLDCDTFPIKPFDDVLLNRNSFKCSGFIYKNRNLRYPDCYFIGHSGNDNNVRSYFELKDNIPVNDFGYDKSKSWLNDKEKFYNLKLEYNENINNLYYINHFEDGTWRIKNGVMRTPLCKYDKEM